MLVTVFEKWILKGIRNIFGQLDNYSLFHPRRARVGKILVILLIILGGAACFFLCAYMAWRAGKETQMQTYVLLGLIWLVRMTFIIVMFLAFGPIDLD